MLYHDLSVNTGIFVMLVEPNSPADRAGLQQGDAIVGFNDQPVGTIDELHKHLASQEIDMQYSKQRVYQPSQITIVRHHQKLVLTITPVTAPN